MKEPSSESELSPDSGWKIFQLAEELAKQASSGSPYREFVRVPSLSCGVYSLPVGAKDMQGPHDEDEIYFVVKGRGRMRVGDKDVAVVPGSVLYVPASSDHSFFEIEEDMTLLVFFGSGG